MTAEEVFGLLWQKYGDEFIWQMLPFTDKYFVKELQQELGDNYL